MTPPPPEDEPVLVRITITDTDGNTYTDVLLHRQWSGDLDEDVRWLSGGDPPHSVPGNRP